MSGTCFNVYLLTLRGILYSDVMVKSDRLLPRKIPESHNDLPIGSCEIESAHRYIIRKRMKIAGVWWKESNAGNMLSLRVMRADGDWESYRKKGYWV